VNPIFANDLVHLVADFGGRVTWGAYVTTGILTIATDDQVNEDGYAIVRGETPVLTYATSTLPGLKGRDLITYEGTDYNVNRVDLLEDGLRAKAFLEKA
jgi:hypothetical protein